MNKINYEIKAKCSEIEQSKIREILKNNNAEFRGIDHQVDTYFKVEKGRLKLRKGNIENCLIYYERENIKNSKKSKVILFQNQEKNGELEKIMRKTHDIFVEVDKQREIYFIDNVKFHIDAVKFLGNFIEIESQSENGSVRLEKLKKQCNYYKSLFEIKDKNLIESSYSDLLLKMENKKNVAMG